MILSKVPCPTLGRGVVMWMEVRWIDSGSSSLQNTLQVRREEDRWGDVGGGSQVYREVGLIQRALHLIDATWVYLTQTRKWLLRFTAKRWRWFKLHLQITQRKSPSCTNLIASSINSSLEILRKVDGLKCCMTDWLYVRPITLSIWCSLMLVPSLGINCPPGAEQQGHGKIAFQPGPGRLWSAEGDRPRQLRQGAAGAAEEDGAHLRHEGGEERAGQWRWGKQRWYHRNQNVGIMTVFRPAFAWTLTR